MKLAPIGIITYARINHLKKTIGALQNNTLARNSELYIFLDGPKKGDAELVDIVRQYIYKIDGFKKVQIKERKFNDRISNYINGVNYLLQKFGKIIFLEDDNVVSPCFLQYMNDGLQFYYNNKNILAISGYNVPAKFPKSYQYAYYLSIYFNAWGFATWADRRHLEIETYTGAYDEILQDKELYAKVKKAHPKLISYLKQIQEGKLDAGDYRLVFHSIKYDLYTIRPIHSYVDNIGHDGSGIHCGSSTKFQNVLLNSNEKINFIRNLKYNKKLDSIVYKYSHKKEICTCDLPNKIFNIMKKSLGF